MAVSVRLDPLQVRKAGKMGRPAASARVSASMKAKLRAKRPD